MSFFLVEVDGSVVVSNITDPLPAGGNVIGKVDLNDIAGVSTEVSLLAVKAVLEAIRDTARPVTDNGGSLTVDTPQLPAALSGGRLDVAVGASALPTGAATEASLEKLVRSEGRWKKRFDIEETVIYVGYAPNGTALADIGWTIKRINLDANGNPTSETWTGVGVAAWSDRLTATYT